MTYGRDVRTWADRLCDEAPPCPAWARVTAVLTTTDGERGYKGILAELLPLTEPFTCAEVGARFGHRATSVAACIRANSDLFELCERRREGFGITNIWRVKPARGS